MRVQVPKFTPALGLRFANAWPHEPVREVDLPPPFGRVRIGDAANGLCGGMSFTVADLFATHSEPPEDPFPPDPAAGDDRYEYIVDRQIDSFNHGWLPLRFYSLMLPIRPKREGGFPGINDSRTYVMVHDEWPVIKAMLDNGSLVMIGLVKTVSSDLRQLNHNHQVIAYGYDLVGTTLKLLILDPNYPRREIELGIDIADAGGETAVTYATSDGTIREDSLVCFFTYPYVAKEPSPWSHTDRDDD
jgi:hypothetical protein